MKLTDIKPNLKPQNGTFMCIMNPPDFRKEAGMNLQITPNSIRQRYEEQKGDISRPIYIIEVAENIREECKAMGIEAGKLVFMKSDAINSITRISTDVIKTYLDIFFLPPYSVVATIPDDTEWRKYFEDNLTILEKGIEFNPMNFKNIAKKDLPN